MKLLYKAELMMCGYSTRKSDNEVEMHHNYCPLDSLKYIFIIVICSVRRITMRITNAAIKMYFNRTKFNLVSSTRPILPVLVKNLSLVQKMPRQFRLECT